MKFFRKQKASKCSQDMNVVLEDLARISAEERELDEQQRRLEAELRERDERVQRRHELESQTRFGRERLARIEASHEERRADEAKRARADEEALRTMDEERAQREARADEMRQQTQRLADEYAQQRDAFDAVCARFKRDKARLDAVCRELSLCFPLLIPALTQEANTHRRLYYIGFAATGNLRAEVWWQCTCVFSLSLSLFLCSISHTLSIQRPGAPRGPCVAIVAVGLCVEMGPCWPARRTDGKGCACRGSVGRRRRRTRAAGVMERRTSTSRATPRSGIGVLHRRWRCAMVVWIVVRGREAGMRRGKAKGRPREAIGPGSGPGTIGQVLLLLLLLLQWRRRPATAMRPRVGRASTWARGRHDAPGRTAAADDAAAGRIDGVGARQPVEERDDVVAAHVGARGHVLGMDMEDATEALGVRGWAHVALEARQDTAVAHINIFINQTQLVHSLERTLRVLERLVVPAQQQPLPADLCVRATNHLCQLPCCCGRKKKTHLIGRVKHHRLCIDAKLVGHVDPRLAVALVDVCPVNHGDLVRKGAWLGCLRRRARLTAVSHAVDPRAQGGLGGQLHLLP